MREFLFLIPVSLCFGLIGLAAFMWALRKDQYDDLDGAAHRILASEDRPISTGNDDTTASDDATTHFSADSPP